MKKILLWWAAILLNQIADAQLTVQENASMFLQKGSEVTVQGDLQIMDDINGTGAFVLNGSLLQHLNANQKLIPSLVVDNAHNIKLTGDVQFTHHLVLNKGVIECGDHNLLLSSNVSVVQMEPSSYIQTNNSGVVRYLANDNAHAIKLPVGNIKSFTPITIEIQGSATSGYVDVASRHQIQNNTSLPGNIYDNSFWSIDDRQLKGTIAVSVDVPSMKSTASALTAYGLSKGTWSRLPSQIDVPPGKFHATLSKGQTDVYILSGNEIKNKVESIEAFPNPVKDEVTIMINSTSFTTCDVSLYNTEGKLMRSKTTTLYPGINYHHIRISNFAAGVYILHTSIPQSPVVKIIKE